MLYEVITRLTLGGDASLPGKPGLVIDGRVAELAPHRITSYNVCYTKLLRTAIA